MKKVIRSVLLLILVLSLSVAIVPSAFAASTAENKSAVYRFLTNTIKLNRAAACGIMANIERESNFNPKSVSVDSNGKLSGGLCQWNGSRFSALKSFCSSKGYDYLSVTGQMQYLKKELSGGYKGIYNKMKSVKNSSAGAYDAGYYWCYYFEVPANKASKSVQRGNLAKTYFKSYNAPTELKAVKVTVSGTVALLSNLKMTWTSGGSGCTGYVVEIAKYSGGSYRWNQATGAYTTGRSYSFSAFELGTGSYAVRVKSMSDDSTKTSAVVKFKIVCKNHLYNSKITKKATATATGVRTFTCQYCGAKVTKTIAKGNSTIKKPTSAKVSASCSSNIATLKFSGSKNADGYIIYIYSGGVWVKLATMPASSSSCKLIDVYKGAKLAVVAFRTYGTKTVKSDSAIATVK